MVQVLKSTEMGVITVNTLMFIRVGMHPLIYRRKFQNLNLVLVNVGPHQVNILVWGRRERKKKKEHMEYC